MEASFYKGNRAAFCRSMQPGSLAVLFSGREVRKTNDEYYPFFAERNFVYTTGIQQKETVLLMGKDDENTYWEKLYLLPSDLLAERWTGKRLTAAEANGISGIEQIYPLAQFQKDLHQLAVSGKYAHLYLDLYRCDPADIDRPSHDLLKLAQKEYPFLTVENGNILLRRLRTIKQPCEIEALRQAEKITGEGILAMMQASRPGMYEYQYKAEFDRALLQHGPEGPGFPSIISAGQNNFCIHYYSYTGQAQAGDLVLNDVGAQYQGLITDVSRAWPCDGKFTEKQKLLHQCALATSDYMFSIIKPGMKMADVDKTIRRYNFERLKDAGVLSSFEDIGTYMWHGGAHHIGFDVHDMVETPEVLAPNMVFCVDVGIYHEEWGIGFRLEDNCLVTETGCENLSAAIPRTVEDMEAAMGKKL